MTDEPMTAEQVAAHNDCKEVIDLQKSLEERYWQVGRHLEVAKHMELHRHMHRVHRMIGYALGTTTECEDEIGMGLIHAPRSSQMLVAKAELAKVKAILDAHES